MPAIPETLDATARNDGNGEGLLLRARLACYRLLAAAASDPRTAGFRRLREPELWPAAEAALGLLREDLSTQPATLAPGELGPDRLDPAPMHAYLGRPEAEIEADYDRVFGLVCPRDCPPYETEFCPQTFSVYRSQQLADVAGFYQAFGVEPSRQQPERHDHLALELEFMGFLIAKELHAMGLFGPAGVGPGGTQPGSAEPGAATPAHAEHAAVCRDAQRRFLAEHLAWWAPAFALALRRKADAIGDESDLATPPRSYLGALGVLLAAFIAAERAVLNVPPPTELVAPASDDAQPCDGCPAEC